MSTKGGFKSEDTGKVLHLQHKYSKSLSWVENLNFPPKTVNNLFKFSDLECLFWRSKNSPVSSDLKPPLLVHFIFQRDVLTKCSNRSLNFLDFLKAKNSLKCWGRFFRIQGCVQYDQLWCNYFHFISNFLFKFEAV